MTDPRPVISTWQLDELRSGDVIGDVSPFLDRGASVVALVKDERGDTDVRQDVANIHLEHHPHQRDGGTRADREPLELGVPILVPLVPDERGREVFEVQDAATPVLLQFL